MGKRIQQDAGNTTKTEGGEGPSELLEQLETNYNNYWDSINSKKTALTDSKQMVKVQSKLSDLGQNILYADDDT